MLPQYLSYGYGLWYGLDSYYQLLKIISQLKS